MRRRDKKEIQLTQNQYFALAKTVYLGNWMTNAHRTGCEGDLHLKEYEEITNYIFSLAQHFDFPKNLEHEIECGDHVETTEVSRIHEEYDEHTFWEELSIALGERDFLKKYSDEDLKKMNKDERFIKLQECIISYEIELEKHGVERLHILKQVNDFGIDILNKGSDN